MLFTIPPLGLVTHPLHQNGSNWSETALGFGLAFKSGKTMKYGVRGLWVLLAIALATTIMAPSASADSPSFLSIGVGWYDINDDQDAVDLRVEYRSKVKLLGFVKPWVGAEVTSVAAAYGVAGVLTDIFLSRRIVLTPGFGVGVYADGDGKDLGSAIEFRSQLELGYRFDNRSKLALAFSHISNAHLTNQNPGSEILTVYYHFPLTR